MELKIKNKREFSFYWSYIYSTTNKTIPPYPRADVNQINICLMKSYLSKHFNNKVIEEQILIKIKKDCDNCLLSETEMIWLNRKDERQINWLWSLILSSKSINNLFTFFNINYISYEPDNPPSNNQYDYNQYTPYIYHTPVLTPPPIPKTLPYIDLFFTFNFNQNPYSNKEKHEIIIKYFDLALAKKEDKINLINAIRHQWNIISSNDNFSWLNQDNEQQNKWCIDYIIDYWNKNNINHNNTINIEVENNYSKFILLFDSWICLPDTKKLFIQSIKKSYSQKKFRDKQVGKKQCSFNLSQKSINQLALLSELQGVPKNHILESLINNKILELGVKQ
ncbi:hypothetical protein [Photobacterium damselae]|uniref:hypothetical protein n=1 Tax=Photobacterium damselae TaxID=38293 RepID=UPI001076755E|nr:hypothetical protein [Photobacterium damselae]MBE8127399.1 hypothetical protein [Photobacterium damselae subsp. piscicida]